MANKKKERNPHNETNSISPTLSYIHNGMQVTISFAKSTVIFLRSSSTGISAVNTTFSSSFGFSSGLVTVVAFSSVPFPLSHYSPLWSNLKYLFYLRTLLSVFGKGKTTKLHSF